MSVPEDPVAMGIRVAAGVTVMVPGRVDLMTPYVLLEQENWFEDEIVFLCRHMQAGSHIVDIGANYGLYTLSLAKIAGPTGRVWALEPASGTAHYLRRSVALNELGHVTVIQQALSDREGTARLSVEGNSELNSLSGGSAGAQSEEVQLSTLDVLADAHGWAGVDFLKLDAEGEEERIIDGGAAFLRSANPLIMFEIRHGARNNLQLVEKLATRGYRSYQLVPGPGILVPFDSAPDPFRLNLFACKPERAAMLERQGALARENTAEPARADPIAHFRAAHDEKTDPAARHAHLQAALAGMTAQCAAGDDAYLWGSCARIAGELGHRQHAIAHLERALKVCQRKDSGPAQKPCLAASACFDTIDPGGRPAEWLRAAILDGLLTLSVFSTYFARGTPLEQPMLDRLQALRTTGFQRAPMERRRQLLRIVAGLQQGPEHASILDACNPDNLNPQLWATPRRQMRPG